MLLQYSAVEMSVQPYIRSKVKQMYYNNGYLITKSTEEGKKTLDVLHNNYRVKRLQESLGGLKKAATATPEEPDNNGKGDIILEVIFVESKGLITSDIVLDEEVKRTILNDLLPKLCPLEAPPAYQKLSQ